MANWAELPKDLLISIAQRLTLMEDYAAFAAVCNSWRVVATKQNFKGIPLWQHIPCLMLGADNDGCREFYSLSENKVVTKIFLPEIKGKKCMYAGFGWLFAIREGEASLVNPCTRDQIELPQPENYDQQEHWVWGPEIFYQKCVLSSSPCQNPSDFVFMVSKTNGGGYLSFWKPGDISWTSISTSRKYLDVVHYKGQFFAIDSTRNVWIVDITRRESQMIADLPSSFPYDYIYYITESLGKLLIVARNPSKWAEEHRYSLHALLDGSAFEHFHTSYTTTDQFQVLELDLITKKFTSILNLGDRALFVGHSASLCIDQASKFPGIRRNHIYFTDEFSRNGEGRDMGIYNMASRRTTPHYKGQSQFIRSSSIWFLPCLSSRLWTVTV